MLVRTCTSDLLLVWAEPAYYFRVLRAAFGTVLGCCFIHSWFRIGWQSHLDKKKNPQTLFSVLSSKRTLSAHHLPNKSNHQRDVDIKLKRSNGKKEFESSNISWLQSGTRFRPLSDEDNTGTKQRCRTSLKIQIKWQLTSSTEQIDCLAEWYLPSHETFKHFSQAHELLTHLLPEPLSTYGSLSMENVCSVPQPTSQKEGDRLPALEWKQRLFAILEAWSCCL